jgi:protein O-mannosyl-transferase
VIDFKIGRRRILFASLLLFFTTLAVYWPARHYDFVNYDDDNYVYENQDIRAGLTWQGFECALMEPVGGNWHPLTVLSHMTDCQFFGLNAGAHHMVNVAFHCTNAALLLLLLEAATGAFWRSAFVAALFALHPLRVESVAWISERKDVLSGFFFMLTLWMYVLYAKEKDSAQPVEPERRRKRFYRLSLAFFLLGLLAKPMVVTLPFVLLFLDFWPLKRMMNTGGPVFKLATLNSLLSEKWPFFLFAFIFCPVTLLTQHPVLSVNGGFFFRTERIVVNYFDYIEKLIWPHNLSFLYMRPETIPPASFLQAALVLFFISLLSAVGWRRCPYLATGWLWFLTVLLPVSGIVLLGALSIADRYTYLPSIGFYLMITWAVADLGEKILPSASRKISGATGALLILSLCALLTRQQLAYWQNTQTLMEHALKIDPDNSVAQVDLRVYLFEKTHPKARDGNPAESSSD